jgi:hypothetical protein
VAGKRPRSLPRSGAFFIQAPVGSPWGEVEQKMERRSFEDDNDASASAQATRPTWRICRVDVRSPLSQLPGHIVRVELEHAERGRITDMGSALDVMGAAFGAVAQILGCKASVLSLHSCHRPHLADEDRDTAMAAIVVECDGRKRRGTASAQDLIYACVAAFIDAMTSGEERDCSLISAGLNIADDVDQLAARPCQASGIDENGDWWLFASDDAGAADAIAAEFRDEGYRQVRLSGPGSQLGGSSGSSNCAAD